MKVTYFDYPKLTKQVFGHSSGSENVYENDFKLVEDATEVKPQEDFNSEKALIRFASS